MTPRLREEDPTKFSIEEFKILYNSRNTSEVEEGCSKQRCDIARLKNIDSPVVKNLIPQLESKFQIALAVLHSKRENDLINEQKANRDLISETVKKTQLFNIALSYAPNEWYPITNSIINLKTPLDSNVTFDMETLTAEQIREMLNGKPVRATARSGDNKVDFLIKMVGN